MSAETGYRDSRRLTQWTLWVLYARIIVALLLIWSGQVQRELLVAAGTGAFESEEALMLAVSASDARETWLSWLEWAAMLACVIAIAMWIHRSCFNARVRGSPELPEPAWAVGSYFVPVANLWLPLVTMREVWGSTAVQAGAHDDRPGLLLGTWWTLFLTRGFLGVVLLGRLSEAKTVDDLLEVNLWRFWLCLATVLICAVFIVMVRRLTALQGLAFREPADQPAPAPVHAG